MISLTSLFLLILNFSSAQDVCPNWTDEKLENTLTNVVNSFCKSKESESCRYGVSKKCNPHDQMRMGFWNRINSGAIPCSRLKSYGSVCRQSWAMSFACKCEAKGATHLPVYQFRCGKGANGFTCQRENIEKLSQIADASKELQDLITEKCKYSETKDAPPLFDYSTFTFVGDPYSTCVMAQISKNPKEEYCENISRHSSDGSSWPDICWLSVAAAQNKKEACDKIKDKLTKAKCTVLSSSPELKACSGNACALTKSKILGLDFCTEIQDISERDHCYYDLATQIQDPYYCKFIHKVQPDKLEPKAHIPCITNLARNLRSVDICDLISVAAEKRFCVTQTEITLGKSPLPFSSKKEAKVKK